MNFEEFYLKLLGVVEPWYVTGVEGNDELENEEVRVSLAHRDDATWDCPECCKACPLHDHGREREWRHLDNCQAKTFLVARLPRVRCGDCGVRQIEAPWAEDGSRFTLLMEMHILRTLHRCQTVKGTGELIRASWDAVWAVEKRGVDRGLSRRMEMGATHIGIDEKAYKKGHRYHTLVYDLKERCVLFINEDRKKTSLKAYYDILSDE